MNLYYNDWGEIASSPLEPATTVADLIDAVLLFCQEQVNCSSCIDTCCAGLAVCADPVFLAGLKQRVSPTMSSEDVAALPDRILVFDQTNRNWLLRQTSSGRCLFLTEANRCAIYEVRPLVCRLHVCGRIESAYKEIKRDIYLAYREALRFGLLRHMPDDGAPAKWRTGNPVLGSTHYNMSVSAILGWVAQCPG